MYGRRCPLSEYNCCVYIYIYTFERWLTLHLRILTYFEMSTYIYTHTRVFVTFINMYNYIYIPVFKKKIYLK